VCLERGPLSLVSTTEELLGRKSSGSGLGNTAVRIHCADHATPSIRVKLALTSPKGGGRSVCIGGLWTEATEFFFSISMVSVWNCEMDLLVLYTDRFWRILNFYLHNNVADDEVSVRTCYGHIVRMCSIVCYLHWSGGCVQMNFWIPANGNSMQYILSGNYSRLKCHVFSQPLSDKPCGHWEYLKTAWNFPVADVSNIYPILTYVNLELFSMVHSFISKR
jgi:hypothetical protein